ncbi:MAG: NAD(P)H-hydrate epimerase, partial [Bacteroidota bacterium]
MKILKTEQIREADQATMKKEPILSIDLMERASKAFFDAFKRLIKKQEKVMVFCGMGNNGGDGLAAARMLASSGYDVAVYKICHSEKSSEDFSINEKRYLKLRKAKFTEVKSKNDLPAFEEGTTLIDAMFGSGLSRPLEGFPAEVVKHINEGKSRVVALDMPSGLMGEDNTRNTPETIVKDDYTFTFQLPKLSFLLP